MLSCAGEPGHRAPVAIERLGGSLSLGHSATSTNQRINESTKQKSQSTMTILRQYATLALVTFTLFGCAEPKPEPMTTTTVTTTQPVTTTKVTTTQTTRVVSLTIGMKGSEAIALAGIPCPPSTLKSIDEGANVTLNHGGRSYVFSKGVLEAVR
jgi:hypothetical protein